MLSTINKVGYNPAFCRTQRVLIADDDNITHETCKLILPLKVKCPPGDTLEINRADSFEEAEEALNSDEKFDVVVSDGHYKSGDMGSGYGDGLIIAQKAADKIGKENVILFSSDEKLQPSADSMGVNFIAKDYVKLSKLITSILNRNSGASSDKAGSAGLDLKA